MPDATAFFSWSSAYNAAQRFNFLSDFAPIEISPIDLPVPADNPYVFWQTLQDRVESAAGGIWLRHTDISDQASIEYLTTDIINDEELNGNSVDFSPGTLSWTRSVGRIATDLSSTTYKDGDDVADGDKAIIAGDGNCQVYLRAGGAWTLVDTTVKASPTVVVKYGKLREWDYAADTIVLEIFAVLERLRARVLFEDNDAIFFSSNTERVQWIETTTARSTWAGEKADVEANPTTVSGEGRQQCYTQGVYEAGPPEAYEANSNRSRFKFGIFAPGVSARLDFYTWGETFNTTGGADDVFDSNGDPIQEGLYTIWDSIAVTAGDTSVKLTAWFGGLTFPHWCDQPTAYPHNVRSKGYGVRKIVVVSVRP